MNLAEFRSWAIEADRPVGVGIAPDGSCFAVADAAGLMLVEDDGRMLWRRPEPGPSVTEIAWPPSGDRFFVCENGWVREFDTDTGEEGVLPEALNPHFDATAVALSADGGLLAAGTARGPVRILNRATGEVQVLHGFDPVTALAWLGPATLAVATAGSLQIWKADQRTLIRTLLVRDGVRALSYAPGKARLAVAGPSRVQVLADPRAGELETVGHVRSPGAIAYAPDETAVLAAVTTPPPAGTAGGERGAVTVIAGHVRARAGIAVSPSGLIAVCAETAAVTVYEPPGAARLLRRDREVSARSRWAAGMARTVGRSAAPRPASRIPVIAEATPDPPEPLYAFAWSPASDGWYAASGDTLTRHGPGGEVMWTYDAGVLLADLAVSGDGTVIAAAAHHDIGIVHLIDAAEGRPIGRVPGGQSPALSPAALLAVPEPGGDPRAVLVYRVADGREVARRPVPGGTGRVAWSPDGTRLAAAADGRPVIWSAGDWRRVAGPRQISGAPPLGQIAWSPDGAYLAVAPVAGRGPVTVFETATWTAHARLGAPGGFAWAGSLAWSPDSRLLLLPGHDAEAMELWDVGAGVKVREMARPRSCSGTVWQAAWSPRGDAVAVLYDQLARYSVHGEVTSASRPEPLPFPAELLARLGGICGEARARAPLSLLAGLLALTGQGGDHPVPRELLPLCDLRAVKALRALRWPLDARIGMVALLTADLPGEDRFAAPAGTGRYDLAAALGAVLTATQVPPVAPPVPVAELTRAAERLDDRMLSLLTILGPEAVQADPLLPLRLRGIRHRLSPLPPRQRRLLGMRLSMTEEGQAEGRGGGDGRVGLSRQGDLPHLLPSQLALPEEVFLYRLAHDQLLYRTRRGRLPAGNRGTILLLDDTPPAHGQVGVTLRICAHLLATSMIERSCPCALVPLGDPMAVRRLDRKADLVEVWRLTSLRPADLGRALDTVRTLTPRMTDDLTGPPRLVLLTHPHQKVTGAPGDLHVLRVHYPGRRVRAADGAVLAPDPDPGELRRVLNAVLSDGG